MIGRPAKEIDQTTFRGRVAARIRQRRQKRRLSVEDAAARAGVPQPTWYHWEKGERLPLDALPAIAAALGCTPRDLIPGKEGGS